MKKTVALLICGVLAGCGPSVNPRSLPPAETFTSERTASEVAQCLRPALSAGVSRQTIGHVEFEQHMIDVGQYDLVPTGEVIYGHYTFTAHVEQRANGSTVGFYFDPIVPARIVADAKAAIVGCL